MDWFGAGVSAPLIVIRAIHFGATAVTAGALIFRVIVARPASHSPAIAKLLRTQTFWGAWLSLAITAAAGLGWLLFEVASMSGHPLREALTPGVLLTVLNETQFGLVSEIRAGLAIVLAAGLALNRFAPANWLALAGAPGPPPGTPRAGTAA